VYTYHTDVQDTAYVFVVVWLPDNGYNM